LQENKLSIAANWIWRKQDDYRRYNDVIIAKKYFDAANEIKKALISITADSRYRLFVNNQWICDGPARGWPEHYYYDQIDITEYLQQGNNVVKVIAHYFGTGHFHGIPQQAGLLAQIDIEFTNNKKLQILTDKSWEIAHAAAWYRNTPKISCQMWPAEFYDARLEDKLDFTDAAVLYKTEDGLWKDLTPRDVPMLTKVEIECSSLIESNLLKQNWHSHSYCLGWSKIVYPGLIQANRRLMPAFALAMILDVKSDTSFHIDITDYRDGIYNAYIDGLKVGSETKLEIGKHLLYISSELNLNHCTDTTFTISGDGRFDLVNPYTTEWCPYALLVFEQYKFAGDDLNWSRNCSQLQTKMNAYTVEMQKLSGISNIDDFVSKTLCYFKQIPAEEMFVADNYRRFIDREIIRDKKIDIRNNDDLIVMPNAQGDAELVYDLGEQNIGYYSFEIESDAGVAIDFYSVEYIDSNGNVQFTGAHRNGMTYITKAGINSFVSLNRRAGRYIFLRFNYQKKPLKINYFKLIESTYPAEYKGTFKCSDENLNRIWDISAHTLKLCMEDTFTDCPLYEQTLWVGDARNESLFAYGVFGAADLAKRCIVLAAQSLERFKMVGCQVPSSWHCILPAWSFLWGISVWEYYWYSKDKLFLIEIWPIVIKNLEGAAQFINKDGLFSGDFWNLFDWAGIDQNHETVLHNSMFMVGAIDAAIKCGKELDKHLELKWLEELKINLCASINNYWQNSKKSYPDSIHEDGVISDSISQHTNFLSLLYDIAGDANKDDIFNNAVNPPAEMIKVGSPFAIFFMYEMFDKFERPDLIVKSIYENYMPMLKLGATAVWESFPTGTLGSESSPTRSHCHAWSSAPLYFFNRVILGIRQIAVGCEAFEISPYIENLDWANGSFLTPRGLVKVSWEKINEKLKVKISAPDGINVKFKDNSTHKNLKIELI
jgi:alpha-L-rhamnosidase